MVEPWSSSKSNSINLIKIKILLQEAIIPCLIFVTMWTAHNSSEKENWFSLWFKGVLRLANSLESHLVGNCQDTENVRMNLLPWIWRFHILFLSFRVQERPLSRSAQRGCWWCDIIMIYCYIISERDEWTYICTGLLSTSAFSLFVAACNASARRLIKKYKGMRTIVLSPVTQKRSWAVGLKSIATTCFVCP